jgi:hypothetical protein
MRRARFLGVVAAIGLVASLTSVAPASAGKMGDVVAATPAEGSKLSSGGYYLLDLKPGESATQQLVVHNTNKHNVVAVVEPVDADTSDVTGVEVMPPGSPKAVTSKWIVVASPQITMSPDERRAVSFTVHVPKNIGPGQYLAAVSASSPLPADANDQKAAGPNQAGFSLSLQMQRAIAVEVDVPGPRAPQLAVTGAEPKATPNGVELDVHIANQGNAFAHGTGVVRVASTKTDFAFKIDTFVSQTAIVYPVQWTKNVVPGVHNVQVDLNYEDGRHVAWNGTINIAGDLRQQLENGLANVQLRKKSGVNGLLILAAVILLLLIGGAMAMRRRRRPAVVKYRAA